MEVRRQWGQAWDSARDGTEMPARTAMGAGWWWDGDSAGGRSHIGTGTGTRMMREPPHLAQGTFAAQELVEDGAGDAEHGGQRQDPADGVAPPGVHVRLVVRQRLVVHHVEHEDALGQGESEVLAVSSRTHGCPSAQHPAPRALPCPQQPPGGARCPRCSAHGTRAPVPAHA